RLKALGIKTFYDRDQVVELWGQDLYQYLSDVYSTKAKYCVIFLSRHYATRLWTRHELKSAQARAFQENREYLLPARFDDTEIPGLLQTIGYVDLRSMGPSQFADMVYAKVRSDVPVGEAGSVQISSDLEKELAEAVILAEDYLLPQPLSMAEAVAAVVRKSFEHRNAKAAYRVVGYLAYQVAARQGENLASWALELTACLGRERKEALERNETRPLWQLLVCLNQVSRVQLTYSDRDYLLSALHDMQSFLREHPHIDPGGECKWKIGNMI
ncbi:MAG: TIR domain-containing protein, partial [Acidobacteria bacterium]|nr:TIR domain-containing protein [Acidobacteriota bacterium]